MIDEIVYAHSNLYSCVVVLSMVKGGVANGVVVEWAKSSAICSSLDSYGPYLCVCCYVYDSKMDGWHDIDPISCPLVTGLSPVVVIVYPVFPREVF